MSLFSRMRQKVLRSALAWRLTGLSWRTATIATRSRYLSVEDYLSDSSFLASRIGHVLRRGDVVLDFGCGIGGNLIVISPQIARGFGVDINRGFVRIARRLARRHGVSNLEFLTYNGSDFPDLPPLDLVFSFSVFERIAKQAVDSYMRQIAAVLKTNGHAVLFFLHSGAITAGVTGRLGADAYVFWSRSEIEHLMQRHGLEVFRFDDWLTMGGLNIGFLCSVMKCAA